VRLLLLLLMNGVTTMYKHIREPRKHTVQIRNCLQKLTSYTGTTKF